MDMILEVSQSFNIRCDKHKFIAGENVDSFWKEAKDYTKKQGCYVFAVKAGKGYTPWYIGKTKRSFKDECFTDNKLVKYNEVLHQEGEKLHGKPVMFFVAPPGGKNVVQKGILDELETFLIQSAKYTNPRLMNKKKANLPNWGIRGVIRGGKGASSLQAKSFSKMMDL